MTDQPSYRLITAAVILIAYAVVAGVVLYKVIGGSPLADATWNQVVLVFNAVGALATTAAGVLLGAEVQQANVRSAQRDAQSLAAAAARKHEAALNALASLDPATAGASLADGASTARAILLQSLGSEPRTSTEDFRHA
ncbi:MAG: hypothetical protein E6G94_04945 [Alphaproteobacteria bacterium]|nr:MAG: hypothetical protein E6G94_04945 [Alphaproteobacteria bacterium]